MGTESFDCPEGKEGTGPFLPPTLLFRGPYMYSLINNIVEVR